MMMTKNKKRKKNKGSIDFDQIRSYKDLKKEKMRLAYRTRYSEKQLEIRLLELGYYLHPVRLIPSVVTEWAQPLFKELGYRVKEYFFGRKRRR
jgi:uncharacterized membrane protein YkvA (DUF1232 family)